MEIDGILKNKSQAMELSKSKGQLEPKIMDIDNNTEFTKAVKDLLEVGNDKSARILIFDTFSNVKKLSDAFRKPNNEGDVADLERFVEWYSTLPPQHNVIFTSALSTMFEHIKHGLQELNGYTCMALVIAIYLPILREQEFSIQLLPKFCSILAQFETKLRFEFAFVMQESIHMSSQNELEKVKLFKSAVQLFLQYLSLLLQDETEESARSEPNETIINAVQTLGIFSAINDTNEFIPSYEFYSSTLEEKLSLKDEYPRWKATEGFSYCNYPFLLSTVTKGDILRIESMIQMRHELQDSFFRAMFIGVNSPYLQLEVRRESVIRDAMFQLAAKSNNDLKKQLRVSFVGEDGIDEGGIQKEFFQVVVKEMFSPPVGLFTLNEESRTTWFSFWDNEMEKENTEEYQLLGKLMGLAFYNSVHLDINFTPGIYRLLLGLPVELKHLREFDPELANGFETLLNYTGNVEEDYQRCFTIELKTPIGKIVSFDLVPNGSNIPVTSENRKEFVDLYVKYFFEKSVASSFRSFKEGFDAVLNCSAIKLFKPEELQELICGSASLDFKELENSTIYDGYEKDTPIIKYFWEVVHEFTDEQKKHLLIFTTGSDRVPVGGLSKLQFVIARNGDDDSRLPTSHTCFNALLLCEYSSKNVLKERLMIALENRNCGFYLS